MMENPRGALAGLRVIELAHIMAGPVCGLMLADLGADVIKLEKVPGGDDTRRMVPPEVAGESAAFMMMNRNKRGIALDLKSDGGREAALRLIDSADVLIENFRGGTMERLGLGYETLAERNPGLVYCAVSGYGRTGPCADQAGFDLIAQGLSGIMSMTGEGPGRPPVKCGAPMTDITAGILAAMGALAAIVQRQCSGRGQIVDTSLMEAGIVHTYWASAIAFATGVAPGPDGSAHPLNAPYQAFETADGWINVGAANQANWMRLLEALGATALNEDPRFSTNRARMSNREALTGALALFLRRRTTAQWQEHLAAAGVPAGPVLDVLEMHDHPQTRARDMVVALEHPRAGRVETLGPPVKLSETPARVGRPAPLYGEHTAQVLQELGYRECEIRALADAGAAILGEPPRIARATDPEELGTR